MIQAEGNIRDRLFDVINVIKVGADERIVDAVGKGRGRIDRLRQGTDATDRDLIVYKRQALQRAFLCGVGVVQSLPHTRAVDQSAEVAGSHGDGGNEYQLIGRLPDGEALVSHEEERFVFAVVELGDPNGTADG